MPADPPSGVNVTYAQQYRRCGKRGCALCGGGAPGHGPYWYAYWREEGRTRSRYLGKTLPVGADVGVTPVVTRQEPAALPPVSDRGYRGLRVRTLGGFVVWRGETPIPVQRWARHKSAAIFKWLLCAPGHRLTRDQATESLWPEAAPDAGARNLRVLIHRLRRVLDDASDDAHSFLGYDGEVLLLRPAPRGRQETEWLDADAFVRAATTALAGHDVAACRAALAMYSGDYLPDDPYEEWAVGRRAYLQQQRLAVLMHLAELLCTAGASVDAERVLRETLAADPCQEAAARTLMRVQAARGHRTEALRTYHLLVESLRRELDLMPEPETQRLYRELQQDRLSGRDASVRADPATARPVQPRLEVAAAHTPLVAREALLAPLRDAVESVCAGTGGLLVMRGAAGVGKSHLVNQALGHAQERKALALLGRAYGQDGQLPYGPLQDALRSYVHAQSPAGLAAHAPHYAVLVRLVPELARLVPSLPAPAPLEPRAERQRLFAALAGLFGDVSARVPIVLALEDLQWADVTTLQAVLYLQRAWRSAPVLMIATYRDDDVAAGDAVAALLEGVRDAPSTRVLDVGPLDHGATATLVGALLAPAPVATDVADLVYARARGNPLFVTEVVAALRAGERLAMRDGAWRLVGAGPLPVPAGIGALLRGPVQRLPRAARQVMRLAAVVGGDLPYPVLRAAAQLDEEALLDGLEDALHAGLIEETALGYTFHHPLLPEAIYSGMPAPRRVLLHERAALALEAHYGEQADERAAELAWHFGQAGRHAEAAHYAQRAGDNAAAAYAVHEAIAHYLRARDHLNQLPETGHTVSALDERVGDLRLLEGDYAQAQQDFARARDQTDDPARVAELWRKESVTLEKRGAYDLALAALDTAERVAIQGTLTAQVTAAIESCRSEVQYHKGQLAEAARAAHRALAALRDDASAPATAHAYHLLGHVAGDGGDLDQAEDCYRRSLSIWEQGGNERGVATAWNSLGVAAFDRGDYARAEECYRRSMAIRERIGDQPGIAIALNNLANLAWRRGDHAAALACYRRNVELWERLGEQRHLAITLNNLGVLAFDGGALAQAEDYHRRSLAIRQHIGDVAEQGVSWVNLGSVASVRGTLAQAEECFRQGMSLFEDSGLHAAVGFAWEGLGTIAVERGETAPAARWYRRVLLLGRRASSPELQCLAALGHARLHLRAPRQSARGSAAASAWLDRARVLADAHALAEAAIQVALLDGDLQLQRGAGPVARTAAHEALERATRQGRRRDEALARRLLGQCALLMDDPVEAQAHACTALGALEGIGATLDAGRCRVLLAEAIVAAAGARRDGAHAHAADVLAQAVTIFAAQNARPDLAEAGRVAGAWGIGSSP